VNIFRVGTGFFYQCIMLERLPWLDFVYVGGSELH
jgi:hypothetical protein